MGFFNNLFKRELSESDVSFISSLNNNFGDEISRQQALEIPAVSSALDFICGTISSLPIKLYSCDTKGLKTQEICDDKRLKLLNEDTGDTLSPIQMRRAIIADMLLDGAGYIYVDKVGSNYRSLRYIKSECISYVYNADPVFKSVKIKAHTYTFYPWQLISIKRNSRDGYRGQGIVQEHKVALLSAYYMLLLERVMAKSGGNKKGFLQAEKKMSEGAIETLKEAWKKLNNSTTSDMIVLNDGVKFQESSSNAMEMQLNQLKQSNTAEIAMLFCLSPQILGGKSSEQEYINGIKSAVMPIVDSLQEAINYSLLEENEKATKYFAVDCTDLLKGDIKSRYEAYRIGIEANILQPDEVRYKEDLPPLGLDFIKLGLNDVLYDTKTKTFYTPNTNQHAKMSDSTL